MSLKQTQGCDRREPMSIPGQQLLLKRREGERRDYQVSCVGGGMGRVALSLVTQTSFRFWEYFCMRDALFGCPQYSGHTQMWRLGRQFPGEVASRSTTLRPTRFTLEVILITPQNKAMACRAWVPRGLSQCRWQWAAASVGRAMPWWRGSLKCAKTANTGENWGTKSWLW